jgi:hypothetical protein
LPLGAPHRVRMSFIRNRVPLPSTQDNSYSEISPSPFNDLWPPTYFPKITYRRNLSPSDREREADRFVRSVWYYWLINGWTNEISYRDLQVLDYHPKSVAIREEIQQEPRKRRRQRQIRARRQYRILENTINKYKLRSRTIEVTESKQEPYSVSPTVTLGRRTPSVPYSITFPKF